MVVSSKMYGDNTVKLLVKLIFSEKNIGGSVNFRYPNGVEWSPNTSVHVLDE